ncbi:MAG: hypothetical protein N3B16_01430 [Candidatus Aminicenantes bacterium]|nr:hypothetical protein [Candidatus Aminicenantes bacterium]
MKVEDDKTKRETQGENLSFELRGDEILANLVEKAGPSLFLGRYSLFEVKALLARKNFFKEARRRGLWPLEFSLDSSEYPVQRIQIYWEKKVQERLIVDLKIKEGPFPLTSNRNFHPILEKGAFLHLEWLTLQNPKLDFNKSRPALPGQARPGLGLGKKVVDLFVYLARLLDCDGILAFPAYFHNALLFSRYFHFINPAKEGEILAIRTGLASIPFKQLAWIVFLNCLRLDGRIYEWRAEEQVLPLVDELKEYFLSKKYRFEVIKASQNRLVEVDWESFKRYQISISGEVSSLIADES